MTGIPTEQTTSNILPTCGTIIERITRDAFVNTLTFLTPTDLAQASATCRNWCTFIRDPAVRERLLKIPYHWDYDLWCWICEMSPFLYGLDRLRRRVWAQRNSSLLSYIDVSARLGLNFERSVSATIFITLDNGQVGNLTLGNPSNWERDIRTKFLLGRNVVFIKQINYKSKCPRCNIYHAHIAAKIDDEREFARSQPPDELKRYKYWLPLCALMSALK